METLRDTTEQGKAVTASSLQSPEVLEALAGKRRLLDRELAEYKALKDEEYRSFEAKLRATDKVQQHYGRTDTLPSNGNNPFDHSEQQGDRPHRSRRDSDDKFPVGSMQERLRAEENKGFRINEADRDILRDVKNQVKDSPLHTPAHEREIEFQGLFTPKYLPLLDKSHQPWSKSKAAPSPSTSPGPTIRSNGRKHRPAPLITPASLPATTYDPLRSPLQSANLSNSAPRPRLLEERRSSSRSDISLTSLRSSLRQAKSPRSPKHVLFSIDNTVLSPSTSPVVYRTSRNPPTPSSGLGETLSRGTAELSGSLELEDIIGVPLSPAIESSSAPLPSMTNSLYGLVEPIITPRNDDEDFQDIGHDDVLFAFDEDVDHRDDQPSDKSNDESSDADEDKSPVKLSNSTQAGSLPIEIVWPSRKDPRK